jgi:hypothetical protein
MKGVKKMISILVRLISIARMKLLMLPKAKKPNNFACKMGLQTSWGYIDDGHDPGAWENENDLRNRCFSRQLKMIPIMYGWPKIVHIIHALPKKDPPCVVNINHLFRPRVIENDPRHP